MKRRPAFLRVWLVAFSASVISAAACGARSGLEDGRASADTGGGGRPGDASPDSEDAGPDVEPFNCEEAGVTYVYIMTEENDLFRFYPPDMSFTSIGPINCPVVQSATPFSMAVDRKGVGYVLFNDGELFTVSTATASCKSTKFVANQEGFGTLFGMGFSANRNDSGEKLFVASNESQQLAIINTKSMTLKVIGTFGGSVGSLELTGTGDGQLFGFGPLSSAAGFHLAEIDKSDATILSDISVPTGQANSAWAFAFWGGDFYFFTSEGPKTSIVTRLHPDDGSFKVVAKLDRTIVGAGVSTCAPQ